MFPQLLDESFNMNRNINLVTNPYAFEIEGIQIYGTNGTNVKDLRMYSTFKDSPIDALEQTLRMRLLYPTCPDTLRGYPTTKDPFILK